METVYLQAHTDADAQVTLTLPESMKSRDVDVTITAREPSRVGDVPRDALGWPIGFWEHYAGSMPDFPEDPEDEPAEDVEPL